MTKVRIVVYKAVVVDKDYGSVSYEELPALSWSWRIT